MTIPAERLDRFRWDLDDFEITPPTDDEERLDEVRHQSHDQKTHGRRGVSGSGGSVDKNPFVPDANKPTAGVLGQWQTQPAWEAFNLGGGDKRSYTGTIKTYGGKDSVGRNATGDERRLAIDALNSFPPDQIRSANIKSIAFTEADLGNNASGMFKRYPDGSARIWISKAHTPEDQLKVLHHEIAHAVTLPLLPGRETKPPAIGNVAQQRLRASYDSFFTSKGIDTPRPGDNDYRLARSNATPRIYEQLHRNGATSMVGIPTSHYALTNVQEYQAETIGTYLFGRRTGVLKPIPFDRGGGFAMTQLYGSTVPPRNNPFQQLPSEL
jgi:hypothetical protein